MIAFTVSSTENEQIFFSGGPNSARPIRVFPQPLTGIAPIALRF
jgi:hypothetical protein